MKLMSATLMLLFALPLFSQQPIALRNGQPIAIQGTLTMEPAGRLQFVTVKTAASYMPMFSAKDGEESPGETLHEISLSNFFDYELLYAHQGEQVTVAGRVAIYDASPYFWHGTRLQAESIVTAKGVDLRDKERGPWVVEDAGPYRIEITLPADLAAPWRYRLDGKPATRQYLSCGSNGGGDVVTCYCAHGFHPTETKSSLQDSVGQGRVLGTQVAQFEVGDDARTAVLSVTCSR